MRSIAGEDILTAWERSRELPEQEAVLALLALASPERPLEELARLPLGERNALLLELRAMTFGRRMEGFAVCPECGAELEFAVDPQDLARGLREESSEATAGFTYRMRPVNSLDLLAVSRATTEEHARSMLLARSLGVAELELEELGDSTAELVERFERMNATAEIRVQLTCVACGSQPSLDLDMSKFLLREIGSAARRLMLEIHELASVYGWSESAIANMSPSRRAAYLEMVHA